MIELLTTRTNELVDVIGLDAALVLVEKCGGTAIWVPKNPKPDHRYAQLIGLEAFKKLCHYYGDTALEIDRCVAVLREARYQKIIADSANLSNRELARKYTTTERHIRRILIRAGKLKNEYQLDLFENLL